MRTCAACLLAVCLVTAAVLDAADSLVWSTDRGEVDAHIESWPLPRVLEAISSETGWQIYVEPDAHHTVSVRFKKLKPREALDRLLTGYNFALLPQVSGPAKLFVYRNSVNDATELIHVTGKADHRRSRPIPTELIVALKHGSEASVDALARRLGATVVARLDAAGAYRLRFGDEAAARGARAKLEHESDVASVETNFSIAPPGNLEPLAMSSGPPALPLPDVSPSADRVVVALIDTAVQPQGTLVKDFLQPGISLFGDYQPPADRMTHGTAMAETLLDGVGRALQERGEAGAKVPVSILPIDIYGGDESTTTFDLARGLYEALNRHANIVNLSLAGDHDSPLVTDLIREAAARGVLFFAAAGNLPVTSPTYPAADPGVIAVTAGDARGDIASYANRGSFVDAMAPGINVVHFDQNAWLGTGTSFSTSWVSGWAAGFMATAGHSASSTQAETLQRWRVPTP